MAHETLVLTCHEGLRDTGQAFGNLFSQVDYLCKRHNVKLPDWIAVQAMRRHTNSSEPLSREDFFYDMRALSRFISAVMGTDVPGELLRVLPAERKPYTKAEGTDVRYVRCIVRAFDDKLYLCVGRRRARRSHACCRLYGRRPHLSLRIAARGHAA